MPEHDTYSLVLGCVVEEICQRGIHASRHRVLFCRTIQFNAKDASRTFGNDVSHHCSPGFSKISGRLAASDCSLKAWQAVYCESATPRVPVFGGWHRSSASRRFAWRRTRVL